MVYLIHFARPIGNPETPHGTAQHYLGYTASIPARMRDHRAGRGSHIMAAVVAAGIPFMCVRTWHGGRRMEQALKQQKNAWRLCPICKAARQGGFTMAVLKLGRYIINTAHIVAIDFHRPHPESTNRRDTMVVVYTSAADCSQPLEFCFAPDSDESHKLRFWADTHAI